MIHYELYYGEKTLMSDTSDKATSKTILILKSNPLTLQSAEQFLIARGWAVMSTTSLTDSVQLLFENKIYYFILCANHPQKKVKQFPQLFKQFTELQFITYTDMANPTNMAILQEMGIRFQVLPPVSGPAIERVIFRIEKEEKSNKLNEKKLFQNEAKNSFDRKKAQENISKFFSSEENSSSVPTVDITTPATEINSSNVESFPDYENRMKRQMNSTPPKKDKDYPFLSDNEVVKKIPPPQKSPPEFQKKIESIIDSSVKTSDASQPVEKVERAQNCICFKIDASSFKGFLVAAMGKDRRLDEELLVAINQKLIEVLQQDGGGVDDSKPMDVKIRSVNFEEWAIEKAEFLKKTIHDGNEVAMAFFPTHKTSPTFGESVAQDMLSIDIDDLASDFPVSFDVYIYLPANNKYLLYIPKNSMLLSSQKGRLKAKGIDKMHAKKDSVEEINKYHAESSLNHSIMDFENNNSLKQKKAE